MTLRQRAQFIVLILLTACGPMPRAQVNAPRVPKGELPPGLGTPDVQLTLVPGTLTPTPPAELLPDPANWAAPFTYIPRAALPTAIPLPARPQRFPADVVNILLIGSDRRPTSTSFRTDVLIIVSIHPSARAAAMISIPRDLYVYIPGFTMNRINTAFTLGNSANYPGGGAALLSDTIGYNFGIPIHYHARVEMDGFSEVIDTLGGVDVHVACSYTDWRLKRPDLNPEDEDNWALYTVPTGVVHMDGDFALWYARSRKRSSDFDRSRRQQEVLRAAYRRILSLGLIPRLPELYGELSQTVSTDMSLSDMLRLAPLAGRITPSRIRSSFIGRDAVTSWTTPTGGAVVLPKPEAVEVVLENAFDFDQIADPLQPEQIVTVEVINVSARQDYGTLAAARLEHAGFETHVATEAEAPGTPTHLIDFGQIDGSARDQLVQDLGLNPAAVVAQPEAPSIFPFRLVVGDDYNPCFDPTRN